jgi:UDP:flavonoid glycosyltransferase YjiC (YdhE family)
MAAIMVLTAGSTGDFEPFAALSERLGSRGHTVTLTADAGFERLAPDGSVEFAPIRADFQSLVPTAERKRPSLRGEVFPVMRSMLEDSWTVARSRQPEVIVAHKKSLAAPHLAEKLGIPHIQALTVPMLTPTREFPLPGIIRHNLGAVLNRASYRLLNVLTRPYAGLIRDWRSECLALGPRENPPAPAKTLYCYSPSRALCGVQSNSDMMVIKSAPHRSLFPRVAAVVHHGGAGTTAAGLLAARPTIVCPFQGDQHFWGAAIHRAGAGPQAMPVKELTTNRLASAIQTASDDADMRTRAADLSERIAQENGANRASEQIESTLA